MLRTTPIKRGFPTAAGRSRLLPRHRCCRAVAFKEQEKPAASTPDTPAAATPDTPVAAAPEKHANNATARGKEVLDKLLRRPHSGVDPRTEAELHGQATGLPPTSSSQPTAVKAAGKHASQHPPAFQAPLSVPVFSRRREVFVGRVAMAGFYASCMWEAFLNGLGPVSQLSVLSGLPSVVVQGVLAAFVLHGAWGLLPLTPTWSSQNRNDLLRRPVGPPRRLANPFSHPHEFFGYSRTWGFTKANELFAGRLAMLGFLGTVAAEPIAKGRGALGQIAYFLHLPVSPQYYQLGEAVIVLSSIVFGVLAYVNRQPGQLRGGNDIYD